MTGGSPKSTRLDLGMSNLAVCVFIFLFNKGILLGFLGLFGGIDFVPEDTDSDAAAAVTGGEGVAAEGTEVESKVGDLNSPDDDDVESAVSVAVLASQVTTGGGVETGEGSRLAGV